MGRISVTVWNENWHERNDRTILDRYPEGIHGALAAGIRQFSGESVRVRTATADEAGFGFRPGVLDDRDVLLWWGHVRHADVPDDLVRRVAERVLAGMGLLVLHSAHDSSVFKRLLGTTCSLGWRNDQAREVLWNIATGHPITQGVGESIVLDHHQTYAEYFDIPSPQDVLFISSFSGGEVFRSGVTFTRGRGRIFYFSPGDQEYPVCNHPGIRRVISNAVHWLAPAGNDRTSPTIRHLPDRSAASPRPGE